MKRISLILLVAAIFLIALPVQAGQTDTGPITSLTTQANQMTPAASMKAEVQLKIIQDNTPGSIVIEVWGLTNFPAANLNIPLQYPSYFTVDQVSWFSPFTEWADASHRLDAANHSITFMGWSNLGGPPTPYFNFSELHPIVRIVVSIDQVAALSASPENSTIQQIKDCLLGDASFGDSLGQYDIRATVTTVNVFEDCQLMMKRSAGNLPVVFSLDQNYPNPFNTSTVIPFTVPEPGQVTFSIYNVGGQLVATLVSDAVSPGAYSLIWDASHMTSSVYFCTMEAGSFHMTRKMVLLK